MIIPSRASGDKWNCMALLTDEKQLNKRTTAILTTKENNKIGTLDMRKKFHLTYP